MPEPVIFQPASSDSDDTDNRQTAISVENTDSEVAAATNVNTEIGGRNGLEPTRYGDWEKNGRCIDF